MQSASSNTPGSWLLPGSPAGCPLSGKFQRGTPADSAAWQKANAFLGPSLYASGLYRSSDLDCACRVKERTPSKQLANSVK